MFSFTKVGDADHLHAKRLDSRATDNLTVVVLTSACGSLSKWHDGLWSDWLKKNCQNSKMLVPNNPRSVDNVPGKAASRETLTGSL